MKQFFRIFKSLGTFSGLIQPYRYNIPLQRTIRNAVDVKWVRPDKKPFHHPAVTGDLSPVQIPSMDTILLEFQDSEELKTAGKEVKKVFSLQYQRQKDIYKAYEKELIDKVRRHPYDNSSNEVKVAKYTAYLRFYNSVLEKSTKKNVKMIINVNDVIGKRNKYLKRIRNSDYRKFEWILDQLNIAFKPEAFDRRVTRKKSLRLLVELKLAQQKEKKLANLKQSLDSQKIPFLMKKKEKLEHIKMLEKKHNLPSTVTDDDIKDCIEKIEKVKIEIDEKLKNGYARKIHPYFLEPYNEKLLLQKESRINSEF